MKYLIILIVLNLLVSAYIYYDLCKTTKRFMDLWETQYLKDNEIIEFHKNATNLFSEIIECIEREDGK